jgi:hypothetical protein
VISVFQCGFGNLRNSIWNQHTTPYCTVNNDTLSYFLSLNTTCIPHSFSFCWQVFILCCTSRWFDWLEGRARFPHGVVWGWSALPAISISFLVKTNTKFLPDNSQVHLLMEWLFVMWSMFSKKAFKWQGVNYNKLFWVLLTIERWCESPFLVDEGNN